VLIKGHYMILTENEKTLYKTINLYQKKIFRQFLIDAITNNDKESFKSTVKIIGLQWGVLRTVVKDYGDENKELEEEASKLKKEHFSSFAERLWNNRESILSGGYSEWTNDNHPHSYESKICFLINPPAFKIIYDSQNKRALGKPNCKPSEWQNLVNDYFEDNKFTAFSIEDYFLNDCNLWLKGRAEK
uniref:hypothetical protein n=1 Tax=Treponema pedis TaxID=409322 RepID=UPI0004940482